jgi:Fic family protein
MFSLDMKISPRLVQQIASIERFAGAWERLSLSEAVASDLLMRESLRLGAEAAIRLDASSPVSLTGSLEITKLAKDRPSRDGSLFARRPSELEITRSVTSPAIENLLSAHVHTAEFDEDGLLELYSLVSGQNIVRTNDGSLPLRRTALNFLSPRTDGEGDEIVFPTVSSFLLEQRLGELLEWTRHELAEGAYHPLFVAGVFHLVFLQIHPFPVANHRLAITLLWRLLDAHGYSFVRYNHFAAEFSRRQKQYFAALRQAEKTALGSWATVNVWLEFFLDSVLQTSETLLHRAEHTVNLSQLTSVQRKIIDVVKTNGSVTRERIVTETGINLSTIKYNLSVLASRGHLKRDGGGRTTSYRVL